MEAVAGSHLALVPEDIAAAVAAAGRAAAGTEAAAEGEEGLEGLEAPGAFGVEEAAPAEVVAAEQGRPAHLGHP